VTALSANDLVTEARLSPCSTDQFAASNMSFHTVSSVPGTPRALSLVPVATPSLGPLQPSPDANRGSNRQKNPLH